MDYDSKDEGKSKGGGLLVALMAKGPRPKRKMPMMGDSSSSSTLDNEPDDDDEGDDAHGAAFDAFADATGIPDDKRGEAKEAMKQFVYACMRSDKSEE